MGRLGRRGLLLLTLCHCVLFVFFSELRYKTFIKKCILWRNHNPIFVKKDEICGDTTNLRPYRSVFIICVVFTWSQSRDYSITCKNKKNKKRTNQPKEEVITGNKWMLGRRIRNENLYYVYSVFLFFQLGLEFYIQS